MKHRFVCASVACFLLAIAASGAAQPADAGAEEKGKAKFDAGREALKQGDVKGAMVLFRASLELNKTAGALLNLANCEEKLGLLASAMSHYEETLRVLPGTDGRVAIAKERISTLKPRVPVLRVRLDPTAPRSTKVLLGQEQFTPVTLDTDIRLDPGVHTILAFSADTSPRRYELTIEAGKKEVIVVSPFPGKASADAASKVVQPQMARPAPGPPSIPLRLASFVTLGVGGAALVGGAITGGMAIARAQDLEKACPGVGPRDCEPSLQPIQTEGKLLAGASTTMFIVAGAALAGGAVMWLVSGRSDKPIRNVGVAAGFGTVALLARF